MKLDVEVKTEYEHSEYLKRACLYEALDRIKRKVSEGKRGGAFEHRTNGYRVVWDLITDKSDAEN